MEINTTAIEIGDPSIGAEIQTVPEEIMNTLSHGIGLILSIPAVFFLISLARMRGSKWHVLSCSIYGLSLMTMYFCSTLYHSIGIFNLEKYKNFFKDLDHCAIYMLIAGTYTPLTMINLVYNNMPGREKSHHIESGINQQQQPQNNKSQKKINYKKVVKVGWALFGIVWAMCFIGVGSKLIMGAHNIPDIFSNGFYLLMGWVSLLGVKDLIVHLNKRSLWLLVAGGVAYTSGVIFLVWETAPFNHAVWHLFVSAGTVLHYFCILESFLPANGASNSKSVIHENLEYAEKQLKLVFFGSGRRRNFIVSYMNILYKLVLGWTSKLKSH
eukprot:gene1431-1805_t